MLELSSYIADMNTCLNKTIITDKEGKVIEMDEGMNLFKSMSMETRKSGGFLYFVGNGASSAMSSHMAADSDKNGGFRTRVFTDLSLMTAVGNDISYDQVFATPLAKYAKPGDILITISSSGNSPNVIEAIKVARDKGAKVVTLSSMKEDNKSRKLGDLNLYVPADTYGYAECAHQVLLHCWLDKVLEES